ncbi:hypothetical protein LIER_37132 [Lithospermum erythrorhizon]|uniref:Integrase catalytic domain-containing protein n=1 Tax=Lithospermum erythrorhizon TaxID=34254 RepID=A0AAV3PGY3_LITER
MIGCIDVVETDSSMHKLLSNQQIMQFLTGLNEGYTPVRGNILMLQPFPSLGRGGFNNYGRGRGNYMKNHGEGGSQGRGKAMYYCDHCSESRALMAGKAPHFVVHKVAHQWIIESGASDHITPYLSLFTSYQPVPESTYIIIPNGSHILIKHIGAVRLSSNISLKNVLHIPDFQYNLLSIQKLCDDLSMTVIFSAKSCFLPGHSLREPLLLGEASKGLYFLDTQSMIGDVHSVNTSGSVSKLFLPTEVDADSVIQNQSDVAFVNDINKVTSVVNKDFLVPASFTTHNLSHNDALLWHSRLAHLPLESIAHIPSMSTSSFKHIGDAFPILKTFTNYIATHFKAKIKVIRSDNTPEFAGKTAKLFYDSLGIVHQSSCVHTPQQNGVVERKQKHLLETARALLFQSNLPVVFWGDYLLTTTYLINRFPLPSLKYKSPFELLFHRQPSYTHLRSFGCLCYVNTPKPGRSKFHPKAISCVFIGYPFGKKAYKLYDLQNKIVIVSKDVSFHEKCYPFHHHILPTNFPLPVIPDVYPTSLYYPVVPSTSTQPFSPDLTDNHDTPLATHDIVDHLHTDHHDINFSDTATHSQGSISPQTSVLNDAPPDISPVLRRSTTLHSAPHHLKDYVCYGLHSSLQTNLHNGSSLSSFNHAFVASISTLSEPRTYKQASQDPLWVVAMDNELTA